MNVKVVSSRKRSFLSSAILMISNVYHPFHISLINALNVHISISSSSSFSSLLVVCLRLRTKKRTREGDSSSTTRTTRNVQMVALRECSKASDRTRWPTNFIPSSNQSTCRGMPDAREQAPLCAWIFMSHDRAGFVEQD